MNASCAADQQWLATNQNLRTYLAGIRHPCFVVLQSVVGQITVTICFRGAADSLSHPILASKHRTLAEATSERRETLLSYRR